MIGEYFNLKILYECYGLQPVDYKIEKYTVVA